MSVIRMCFLPHAHCNESGLRTLEALCVISCIMVLGLILLVLAIRLSNSYQYLVSWE